MRKTNILKSLFISIERQKVSSNKSELRDVKKTRVRSDLIHKCADSPVFLILNQEVSETSLQMFVIFVAFDSFICSNIGQIKPSSDPTEL